MHKTITFALVLVLSGCVPALAAVPLRWTVETSRAQPVQFDAYHGETLDLAATFQTYGRPLAIPGPAALYYQTNGMGSAWWTAPATVSSNTISATFAPALDPGAPVLNCFLGGTASTYRASFRLRLLASPGATPNAIQPPVKTLDLSAVTILNAPWPTPDEIDAKDAQTLASANAYTDAHASGTPSLITDGTNTISANLSVTSRQGDYTDEWDVVTDPQGFEGQVNVSWMDLSFGTGWAINIDSTPDIVSEDPDATIVSGNAYSLVLGNYVQVTATRRRSFVQTRLALTNDIPRTAADIGAYPSSSGTSLQNIVNTWQSYWGGDDVRFTITNYYGSADMPHSYIEEKMPADADHAEPWFKTVWDEMTRWNWFLSGYANFTNFVCQNLADRAWGTYDSSTGADNPDGLLQISHDQIQIASGLAYQKTVTAQGELWVLTATDPTTISGVTSNGFFRIEDGDGNSLFEIVKGGKRTVGATTGGIRVTDDEVQIDYSLTDNSSVIISSTTDLRNGSWETVEPTWTGTSGSYTAHLAKPETDRAFFRATYEVGGETYIRNSAPVSTDSVVIGGQFYRVSVETVNGKKLMVLTDD